MKFRTAKYHISQAFDSLFHNRLMTLAAIATVSACSFILIITLSVIFNIDYMLGQVEDTVGITVYLGDMVTEDEASEIEDDIKNIAHIKNVTFVSKDDAFKKAKEYWGSDGDQLDSLKDDNPLPRSFEISVDDLKNQDSVIDELEQLQITFEERMINNKKDNVQEVAQEESTSDYELTGAIPADSAEVFTEDDSDYSELPMENTQTEYDLEEDISSETTFKGIEKIRHAKDVSNMLMSLSTNVHIITFLLLIVMIAISVAIIMNTIKLTVFIRRNEINIMKYVGATDRFIRWPFLLEGIIIGFIGAIIPYVICLFGYMQIYSKYMNNLKLLSNVFKMQPTGEIFVFIFFVSVIFGSLLGAVGSITSIRKHLNV